MKNQKNKYEEAFYDTNETLLPITYAVDLAIHTPGKYMSEYHGHLLCPICRAVQLTLVNGKTPFFRGFPKQRHQDERCENPLPIFETISIDMAIKDPTNLEQALKQMDSALRRTFSKTLPKARVHCNQEIFTLENDMQRTDKQNLKRHRFPEKRIDAPLSPEDFSAVKIFYGVVSIISTRGKKDENSHFFTLFSIKENRKVCVVRATPSVWNYLKDNTTYQQCHQQAHVTFLGKLSHLPDQTPCCTLIRSDLLKIELGS